MSLSTLRTPLLAQTSRLLRPTLLLQVSLFQHRSLFVTKSLFGTPFRADKATFSTFNVDNIVHNIPDLDSAPLTDEIRNYVKGITSVRLPHAVYTMDQLKNQQSGHHTPKGFVENAAYYSVMALRSFFDLISGYSFLTHTETLLLRRVVFLETVAGVPGMIGAMNRHLRSLRRIQPDYGWIHTLLEEAENERMHLMTSLMLMRPGMFMKLVVLTAQAGFVSFYTLAYALSPMYCHRFVGYLEEEAFKTYTGIDNLIVAGKLPGFTVKAPTSTCEYWGLPEGSTLREVFLAIRADENHHRIMNHTFADMQLKGVNPFPPGF